MKPDLYQAIFDASPYPYLVFDAELTIIGANAAYLAKIFMPPQRRNRILHTLRSAVYHRGDTHFLNLDTKQNI